jgi:hypothetical protein
VPGSGSSLAAGHARRSSTTHRPGARCRDARGCHGPDLAVDQVGDGLDPAVRVGPEGPAGKPLLSHDQEWIRRGAAARLDEDPDPAVAAPVRRFDRRRAVSRARSHEIAAEPRHNKLAALNDLRAVSADRCTGRRHSTPPFSHTHPGWTVVPPTPNQSRLIVRADHGSGRAVEPRAHSRTLQLRMPHLSRTRTPGQLDGDRLRTPIEHLRVAREMRRRLEGLGSDSYAHITVDSHSRLEAPSARPRPAAG